MRTELLFESSFVIRSLEKKGLKQCLGNLWGLVLFHCHYRLMLWACGYPNFISTPYTWPALELMEHTGSLSTLGKMDLKKSFAQALTADLRLLGRYYFPKGFPVAQLVKNPPAMRETWVWSLGWEDPLEKGKATHSSILAWRIPWTV